MKWLKNCCCCLTLRTGSLAAGSWTLFTATLMASLQVYNILSLKTLTKYQIKHGPIKLQSAKVLGILEIGFGIILALLSLLLAFAVFKDRRKLLLPYVVGVLLYQVFDISTLLFYVIHGVKVYSSVWIPDTLIWLINMYCVIGVLSFYKELTQGQQWRPLVQANELDEGYQD